MIDYYKLALTALVIMVKLGEKIPKYLSFSIFTLNNPEHNLIGSVSSRKVMTSPAAAKAM